MARHAINLFEDKDARRENFPKNLQQKRVLNCYIIEGRKSGRLQGVRPRHFASLAFGKNRGENRVSRGVSYNFLQIYKKLLTNFCHCVILCMERERIPFDTCLLSNRCTDTNEHPPIFAVCFFKMRTADKGEVCAFFQPARKGVFYL